MQRIKELVASVNFSARAFAVADDYAGWETDEIIAWETWRNMGNFVKICVCQVSAWQSATLLSIICNSVQPAAELGRTVEESVMALRHSSTGGATNNPPYPKTL